MQYLKYIHSFNTIYTEDTEMSSSLSMCTSYITSPPHVSSLCPVLVAHTYLKMVDKQFQVFEIQTINSCYLPKMSIHSIALISPCIFEDHIHINQCTAFNIIFLSISFLHKRPRYGCFQKAHAVYSNIPKNRCFHSRKELSIWP